MSDTFYFDASKTRITVILPQTADNMESMAKDLEDRYNELRSQRRDQMVKFSPEPDSGMLKDAAFLRALALLQRQIDELKKERKM